MSKIIGHKDVIDRLRKRSEKNSFSHANLIAGTDGIGKSLVAKYLASHILCNKDDAVSVDIVNYRPSSNSFGVDEVREIIDEVNKKPYENNRKVIILYKCDKMTVQAQNAFLKTVEEPPEGVYLILLSDSLETILDTIQSRCQIYKLTPLLEKEMGQYIEEKYNGLPVQSKQAALAYSMGIPGKVDKFIEDEKLNEIREVSISIFEDLIKKEKDFVLKYEKILNKFNNEKDDILDILLLDIRDILLFKELNNKDKVINLDYFERIKLISRSMSYKRLNSMLEYIKEARQSFNSNSNYSMTISVMLMGFVEGKFK